MKTNSTFGEAVAYVKANVSSEKVQHAKEVLAAHNMELADVDESLDDDINDLMEEFGSDHDLPEGWWLGYGTTEDILWKL